mgnify:CR=1 FL=1
MCIRDRIMSVITLFVSGFLIDKFTSRKVLVYMNLPLLLATIVIIYFNNPFTAFIFLGLIGISNGFANVLGSSTWAEIYGVKYIGSIKALTTALMVFSTAFGTAFFGILIDRGFSIEKIAVISSIYISISLIMLFIIRSKLNPSLAPKQNVSYTFFEKIKAARNLLPVVALIFFVLGSIYGGYATPTEAATIGVIGALILAWSSKSLSFKSFMASLMGAVKTSCMINFIIVGASFLSVAMGYSGIPKQLGQIVNEFQLSQLSLLAILTILYIFLGCFLEVTSMMVLSESVVLSVSFPS